jgi:hypothetical protein
MEKRWTRALLTAVLLATPLGVVAQQQPPPGGPGAATDLAATTECASPGKEVANLSWTPAAVPGTSQQVEATIYSFEQGQVDVSETLPPDQASLVFEELHGQAIHFWRVVTEHSDGPVPSETAKFRGPLCTVDILNEEEQPPIP